MKKNLKYIAKFIISWLLSFLVIYLFVFFGGYKLFESSDVILQGVGFSFVVGLVIFITAQLYIANRKKIESLEKRMEELEKQCSNK